MIYYVLVLKCYSLLVGNAQTKVILHGSGYYCILWCITSIDQYSNSADRQDRFQCAVPDLSATKLAVCEMKEKHEETELFCCVISALNPEFCQKPADFTVILRVCKNPLTECFLPHRASDFTLEIIFNVSGQPCWIQVTQRNTEMSNASN